MAGDGSFAATRLPRPLAELTVAVVGLGLMGGSLAGALEGVVARRVGVAGPHPDDAAALDHGLVDELVPLEAAAAQADVVVLAAPVRAIERLVVRAAASMRPGAVLTDLGSVKGPVVAAMDALDPAAGVAAIGGHPMCGSERTGSGAARADLFRGATWVLSPSRHATAAATTLVEELVRAVGASPLVVGAARHDELAALASHLPYALGQSLLHALAADREARTIGATACDLAAGGMRDATRVAAGSVEMWRDILATNASAVRRAFGELRGHMDTLESMLEDPVRLDAWLRAGQLERDRLVGEPG